MTYQPKPLDTSQIELSASLGKLTERLARNVHETWARQRIAEGWRLGPERNDEKKEHPCFIPYDELPHEQQVKDALFMSTVGVLKALL